MLIPKCVPSILKAVANPAGGSWKLKFVIVNSVAYPTFTYCVAKEAIPLVTSISVAYREVTVEGPVTFSSSMDPIVKVLADNWANEATPV